MKGSQDQQFKDELKQLIHTECRLGQTIKPENIPDDEVLFGPESSVGLDSIDALQISLALQKKFNITITDSKELRRIFVSVNSLADYIKPE